MEPSDMILPQRRWQRKSVRPLPLFDRPRRSASDTSRAAAQSLANALGSIEGRIIDYLAQRGSDGSTADEAEVALGLRQATGSARFSELTDAGRIIRTQRTRPTRSGRAAYVHVHPQCGVAEGCSQSGH
jgi:hypothetical protein